jgi:hypothetical protein
MHILHLLIIVVDIYNNQNKLNDKHNHMHVESNHLDELNGHISNIYSQKTFRKKITEI